MPSLHAPLLAWFDAHQRDLPWRRTKDPYAIWVSEIMLQQTQVATVIPYYERWMARFPDIQALAAASEEEVLSLWQGLGYYRRAKQLRAGAQSLTPSPFSPQSRNRRIEESKIQALLSVPGIGPYTAGAIASIAFNEPVPLVDGNVERVYARLNNDASAGTALKKAAWKWAEANVHPDRPGDWNQALMELGATICKPADPLCPICPVAAECQALQAGTQNSLPTPAAKPKVIPLVHHVWIPVCDGQYGLRQIPDGQWWAGMWEFPRSERLEDLEATFPGAWPQAAGSFRHTVTCHRIQVHVSVLRLDEEAAHLRWVSPTHLKNLPLPAPQRKALKMAHLQIG